MKLEIISGTFVDTIYGITLDEGRTPCLSSLSEDELSRFSIPEVEPALWFKTLVVTRVTVDCVRRHMTWATEKSCDPASEEESSKRISSVNDSDAADNHLLSKSGILRQGQRKIDLKRLSESVFMHASSADVSTDVEELFTSTEAVVTIYRNERIPKVEFYAEMFRILHCYILPAITFDKEDVPQLEAAMEFQNALLQRQDTKISSKNAEMFQVSESMARQRENYACDIEVKKSGLKLNYPRPLAAILLNHFQDDLQQYSTQLAGAQADVNLLKAHIRKFEDSDSPVKKPKHLSTSCSIAEDCPELKLPTTADPNDMHLEGSLSELIEELRKMRVQRDKIFQKYKRMLHIREIMSEYVSDRILLTASTNANKVTKRKVIRSKLHLSGKVNVKNPLHKIYLEMVDVRREKTKETQKLVEDKVRLVSVKEGIRAAIEELRTSGHTYGIEFDHFGSLRSTDIMARPKLPTNWRTLEEQVKQIIDDTEEPLSLAHTDGCEKILNECKLLLKFHNKYLESESDSEMHSGSPDTASLLGSFAPHRNHSSSSSGGTTVNGAVYQRRPSDANGSYLSNSDDFSDGTNNTDGGDICVPLQNLALAHQEDSCRSTRSSLVEFEQLENTEDDLVIIHDISPDYARKAVEKLQKQIKRHMENMAQKLHVQTDRGVSLQKVWACYERIFFSAVNSDLKKIYKLAYMDVLKGLEEEVPKLTPFNLAMDNSIVYPLFCDRTLSPIVRNERTTVSKDHTEPLEDSVFEEVLKTDESSMTTEASPAVQNQKLNRLRSDSALIKSVKKKNRETIVLSKNATSSFNSFENSVDADQEENDLADVDKPDVHTKTCSTVTESRETEDVDLEQEFDEFLEISPNQDGVYDCKQASVTQGNRSSLPSETGTLPQNPETSITTSVDVQREPSISSNYNIDLAESIISGTASGQLKKEAASENLNSTSTLEGSSSGRTSMYVRSKYANVLDQINMDFARHVQKDIRICYPVSVNLAAADRSTWPLAARSEDIEVGQDVLTSCSGSEDLTKLEESNTVEYEPGTGTPLFRTASSLTTKTIQIKPEYKRKLQGVVKLLEEMCEECTPTEKLKKAFLALKELGTQFVSFSSSPLGHGTFGASADELSDFLVVLLCNIEMKLLLQIYVNAQMMRDLMAEYLETGPYGFSVMQLIIGLHFLQERIVMQRGLVLNHQQYSVMC